MAGDVAISGTTTDLDPKPTQLERTVLQGPHGAGGDKDTSVTPFPDKGGHQEMQNFIAAWAADQGLAPRAAMVQMRDVLDNLLREPENTASRFVDS